MKSLLRSLRVLLPCGFVVACQTTPSSTPLALSAAFFAHGETVQATRAFVAEIACPPLPATPAHSSAAPLAGLRIALDPGHMGGTPWDYWTGKYIFNSQNQKISEGVMALQLARLLRDRLERAGAKVLLTREHLAPVASFEAEQVVRSADGGQALLTHVDLQARADKIAAFRPGLTLILHFDESTPGTDHNVDHLQARCNTTRAYIPGSFFMAELTSVEDRRLGHEIYCRPDVWRQSERLSRLIAHEISTRAIVPLATEFNEAGRLSQSVVPIEPGVFARNLYLQRHLGATVSSYVETLCYEDPEQFRILAKADHQMMIDGEAYAYSARLEDLAEALSAAVLRFARGDG